jgi:HK97 gp10 family phage protein
MATITIDIKGMTEALGKFDKYGKKVQAEIKDEVNASALKIQSDAKKLAPVNLGTLRNTIYLVEQSVGQSKFMFSVGASAKYAPFVEFGTGGKVSIPTGYESYASQFKGKTGGTFKEMVLALTDWVQKKGIASGKQSKSAAYMIALSILRKGLRPQPFLIPAFEQERPKLKSRILNIIKDAKS